MLERSADGRGYTDASTLLPGAGSSSAAHAYVFTNVQAPAAATYYRLRQLDASGAVAYSPVALVATAATSAARLACFPQPAHTGTTESATLPLAETKKAFEQMVSGHAAGQLLMVPSVVWGFSEYLLFWLQATPPAVPSARLPSPVARPCARYPSGTGPTRRFGG